MTEKFRDYLYGNQFTVATYSKPLTYILTTAVSYMWMAALSTFNFKLQIWAGKLSIDADGLSSQSHGGLITDTISPKEQDHIHHLTQTHLNKSQIHLTPDED